MARHFLIFTTICFSSFVLLGGVSGSGKEDYNHATTTVAKTKREVQDNIDQAQSSDSSNSIRNNLNNANVISLNDRAVKATDCNDDYIEANNNNNNNNRLRLNFVDTMSNLPNRNIVKRAPNGFTGMRGKKETEITDYAQNTFDWNAGWDVDDTLVGSDRSLQDLTNTFVDDSTERYKKAPSAFFGVRGKKFSETYRSRSNNLDDLLRKMEEDRLREELLQDFLGRIATSSQYQNEIQKRAPSGFAGVRGKRDMNDDAFPNQEDKRSPANAFHGVRGKKDMMMIDHQAFKRSPAMAFYGTRGKKQPFVDFRNKFVGVRGKKSFSTTRTATAAAAAATDSAASPYLNSYAGKFYSEEIEPNTYDAQTRYFVDMFPIFFGTNDKRAPNGFIGMRGKRAT